MLRIYLSYVQGINDIATPFIMVFISSYCKLNLVTLQSPQQISCLQKQHLFNIQADTYWCLCKLMDGILDNYTSSWPGIKKSFKKLKRSFSDWIEQNIDFYHLYFKWINCLLLRQFSPKVGLRLFDTYISQEQNCGNLCLYVMAAILLKFSKKIRKMHFQEFMLFTQNMPTKLWTQAQQNLVISEAYVYQQHFI